MSHSPPGYLQLTITSNFFLFSIKAMMDQSVLGYDKYEKRKRYPKESFSI